MTMHVLIINPQLAFTVALKQALERTGSYVVHPFTSPDAALEYLRNNPQDVALVRADVTTDSGLALIRAVRGIQPDLPLIVSPDQPEAVLDSLLLQAGIDEPFQARELIPLLNRAADARDALAKAVAEGRGQSGPPAGEDVEATVNTDRFNGDENAGPAATPLDTVLEEIDEADIFDLDLDAIQAAAASSMDDVELPEAQTGRSQALIDFMLPDDVEARAPHESSHRFRQLADEEPPLPDLEENGTVSDLLSGVTDPEFLDVLALLNAEETPPEGQPATLSDEELQQVLDAFYSDEDDSPPGAVDDAGGDAEDLPPDDDDHSPARVILETALDESTPPEEFSLDELIASIERRLPENRPNVQPLPSWLRETQPLVAEPDFLPEEPAKVLPVDFTGDLYDQTTRPSGQQHVETRGGELETEMVDFFSSVQPPASDLLETIEEAERIADDTPFDHGPVINLPEDVDATVEPLLLEKFAGAFSDTREVEVVSDAPEVDEPVELPEAWPEELTVDEAEAVFEDLEAVAQAGAENDFEPEPAAADAGQEPELQPDAPAFGDTAEPPSLPEEDSAWTGERLPPLLPREESQFESALFDTTFDRLAAFDFPDAEILQLQPDLGARPLDDPRIAQAALSLTHASLESTAEATLLTRNGEIVAFAGNLTREELEELRKSIADDWDTSVEKARLRFFTLESSGRECMLYSRHTEDDLVLSMLFYGTTKLKDIRRQGERLLRALRSVPEPAADEAPPPVSELVVPVVTSEPPSPGPLTPYTVVWVLADPNAQLAEPVARALVAGLTTQLGELGWVVHEVRAEYEFVMVYADMPAEQPQDELVDDLKRRAAAIASAVDTSLVPDTLWADGYLLVAPGRELQLEDIQSFIEFERM